MRIAMLAPFGIRPKGTLSARMLPLAQELAIRGHTPAIYAPAVQNPEDAGTSVWHGAVLVRHVAAARLPGPLAGLEQANLLLRETLAFQPDLIHLFKPKGFSGLAALAASLAYRQIPLVVDSDDWEGWGGWNDLLPYPGWAKQLFAWQEQDLPRRAAMVTVVSRTLEQQVRGWGVPAERICYLPNGMQRHAAAMPVVDRSQRNPLTLLLYTRFWEFEIAELIEALVEIARACQDIRLLVVGRGERGEEQQLIAAMHQVGLVHILDYRGWAEPAQIPGLLAEADIALVPMANTLINRARGLAKLLELMQAGLPIVANRVGMVSEYLEHGQSGLIAPAGQPQAFALAVIQLIHDSVARQRLGHAACERVALFGWDRLTEQLEAAYRLAREHA
ncbi:MAG: glycosyltransferase family 4 protein [Roseiflexaceae bacterium]